MKYNIDLTENRDFKKISFNLSSIFNKSCKIFLNNDYLFEDIKEYGFFTGNKKIRKLKTLKHSINNNIDCECCGRKLNNIAWREENNLCIKCKNRLKKEFKKTNFI